MKKNHCIIGLILCCLLMIPSAQSQNIKTKRTKESKFVYMTSLGFNAGVGILKFENRQIDNRIMVFNVNQLLAYQFNPYVTSGIGLGVDVWKKTAFIPLTANLSINFMDHFVTPHWYVNVGYAFKWYVSSKPEVMERVIQGATPGWHLNSGFGAKIKIKDNLALMIAADYRMQNTTLKYSVSTNYDYDYSLVTTNRTVNKYYHFVGVKIGLWYW
ncbi:MAG: hypothetical protein M0P38_04540 [Bacteroidales bacterium]|jgi:hypothetical protein|nr:hypothetical protein [Bacteroidales bacterium]